MAKIKIRKVGNSLGTTFPSGVVSLMQMEDGDEFYITRARDGMRITPYSPEFEREIEAIRKVMKRRRNVLRELAK